VSRFEDRLLAELLEQHGAVLADLPARPLPLRAPARRSRVPARPWRVPAARTLAPAGALALALATLLVALVIGFGSGGGGGTPAYAVMRNSDGTVTVTIRELVGVAGANEALGTLGVRARVVRSLRSCPARSGRYRPARLSAEASRQIVQPVFSAGAPSVVIEPSAIPPADTVVIGVRTLDTHGGPAAVGLETAIYEGSAPPCLRASGGD